MRALQRRTRALLTAVLLVSSAGCGVRRSDGPDIFLIIIDTLRADHLSCYGYGRETSPVLDSLAAAGTLFARCQAQAPWTLPACASIWTGMSVASHGAGMRGLATYGLSPDLATIGTVLKSQGYVTLAFVNTVLVSGVVGFARDFDYYSWDPLGHGRAGETVDEALGWFQENRGNPAPKLVVIHLFDVHAPYDPPAGFDSLFGACGSAGLTEWRTDSLTCAPEPGDRDHLVDMYDGEIAWVDSQLGRLFAELRRTGVADHALIVVTADHGEEFLDHGCCGHSHTLYQELLHVPLIVSGPGIPAGVVDSIPRGQIDILPTLAAWAGAPVPAGVEGIGLFSTVPPDRVLPSSGVIRGHFQTGADEEFESICSVMSWPLKGVMNFETGEAALYDLRSDPGESAPLPLDSTLTAELDYYRATPPRVAPPVIFDRTVDENLEGLGYIR